MEHMQQMSQANSVSQAAESLTPEQMQKFKQGYQIGQQILFDNQRFSKLADSVSNGDDPSMALAGIIVLILKTIEKHMGDLEITVLLLLGVVLLSDIAQALKDSGDMALSGDQVQAGLEQAIGMWLRQSGDRYSQEEIMGKGGGGQAPAPSQAPPREAGLLERAAQ